MHLDANTGAISELLELQAHLISALPGQPGLIAAHH